MRDARRWIYGGLDVLFVVIYVGAIWKVIPNRLPSAQVHLWSLPIAMAILGAGMFVGGRRGWWTAIAGGSLVLASAFLLIARILVSASFLAGTYGAFGKAAASFALITVLLVIELVVLVPIFQVKYLMSRRGRQTFNR